MNFTASNRRSFIKQLSLLSSASLVSPLLNAASSADAMSDTKQGYTFLFQGDSITDGNRGRNNDWNHVMGHGYQFIIASKLWYEWPKKGLQFFNRGISGNTIVDLTKRWDEDALSLKPDLLSILVGINDVETLFRGKQEFTSGQFESGYQDLLDKTVEALPNVQLVLCEPFILPVGRVKDKWAQYDQEMKVRRQIVKNLATQYKAIFVPFQNAFNNALKQAPAEYWIWDGIHPMPAGHELMAREWIKQVGKKLSFVR